MSDTDDAYIGVIVEEIRDQNKAILEAVGDMQKHVVRIPKMADDIKELKQDVKVIKAVVTDHSKQQTKHEQRIRHLEST